ncbi:MAG: NAD(P) transhydrogenase subunit alpha [Clostridia bacterium]|nr:NAD(P) transhydrogenase subunit alpha [Clostridia bacterium]
MHDYAVLEAYIFALAVLMGFQLISKVPSVLHTPLMSATNAVHGVILVGAIVVAGEARGTAEVVLGFFAVLLATMNVVGGFVVTDRMLGMFRRREPEKAGGEARA